MEAIISQGWLNNPHPVKKRGHVTGVPVAPLFQSTAGSAQITYPPAAA
jgi:hypothetical protein